MIIRQFFIPGIAHSSYMVAGNSTCAVIDPARDVDRYIRAAQETGCRITQILETHLHADFISGHLDLAEATGAAIGAPRSANCAYPHTPLGEGDVVRIEDITFTVIETAGHTPEHICYVATDLSRGETPVALFSGDTLLVGDVGRPDLFMGKAGELASRLYDNLQEKILALPCECEVYPAHGMGSLCGRAMAAKRTSTIGYEKRYNYALRFGDRARFVRALTTDMPAAPDHFARCSGINQAGPALVKTLEDPVPVGPEQFFERNGKGTAVVLDTRDYPAFSGAHIPGAWNIALSMGPFATLAGWVLPPGREILLVLEDDEQVHEAVLQLRRVGFDRIAGFLSGGMPAWISRGLPAARIPLVSAGVADALTRSGEAILIDVREEGEWQAGHAERSIHIPWHDLRTRHSVLDPSRHTLVMCKGGPRGSIAASILKMHGFVQVSNLAGGYEAYRRAGFAP